MLVVDNFSGLLHHEVIETAGPVDGRRGVVVGWGSGYLVVILADGTLATFDPAALRPAPFRDRPTPQIGWRA